MTELVVRESVVDDAEEIVEMIKGLAAFHDAADQVRLTTEQFRAQLFNGLPDIFVTVVEAPEDSEHRLYGFALWYRTYSTWEGEFGIHLEDLYVRPESRGTGAGGKLLRHLAVVAKREGYTRIEWSVAKENENGIQFYLHHGAKPLESWETYRLDQDAIDNLVA